MFCDYFLLRVANALPKVQPYKKISLLINILTVLLLLILLTPDTLNSLFNWSHIADSSILFVFELSFASWLVICLYHDKVLLLLLVAQFFTAVLAMLSQFHVIYYLSEGILFFQLFFGILLTRSISKLLTHAAEVKVSYPPKPLDAS